MSCRDFCRQGMRVDPPTRTISVTSPAAHPASSMTSLTVSMHRENSFALSSSNLDLSRVAEKSKSPTRESTSISADLLLDRTRLQFSTARRRRDCARALFAIWSWAFASMDLILAMHQFMTELSKSSPPRWVSPPVALTSNTPESMARTETSKVPPPRSKITTLVLPSPWLPLISSFFWCNPYERAAAVGSLMILFTSNPAIRPASLVACRC
mmetsp:Transcript_38457/g.82055  ORF Transcript_38457/g.82055 Transcript_38457/m.82055 type:complete len:212 (+) Transcript_38457:881-1516(+)